MGWNKSTIRGFDEGWNVSAFGLPTATFTEEASSSSGGGTTTLTFATVGIGTAFATRRVFFAIGALDTGENIVSATINGSISATVFQNGTGENHQGLITAVVPTGTTMSLAITFSSANFSRGNSCTWVADDSLILSATPNTAYGNVTSATSLPITTLVTQQGGFTLFYQYVFGTAATTSIVADDSYVIDIQTSTRVRGHSNGTTARTSNITFNESATTNIHAGLWNFR